MMVQRRQAFLEIAVQVCERLLRRQDHDEDTAEFGLQDGLTDIFNVAVLFEQHPGHSRDDAGSIRPQDRNDGLVHGALPLIFLSVIHEITSSQFWALRRPALENQAVGDKLPEVFDRQILQAVVLLDVVELPVTAVTGHHDHRGA